MSAVYIISPHPFVIVSTFRHVSNWLVLDDSIYRCDFIGFVSSEIKQDMFPTICVFRGLKMLIAVSIGWIISGSESGTRQVVRALVFRCSIIIDDKAHPWLIKANPHAIWCITILHIITCWCFNDNPTKVLYHKLIASSKVVLSCEPCWPFVGPSDHRISSVHSPTSRFSLVQKEEFSPAISPDAVNTLNIVTVLVMNTRCLVHAELCFEWCGSTWSFSHVSTINKVHTHFLCVFVTIRHW